LVAYASVIIAIGSLVSVMMLYMCLSIHLRTIRHAKRSHELDDDIGSTGHMKLGDE
jgi:hypothetical protein